jgi:carboxymethylenebutenolidase
MGKSIKLKASDGFELSAYRADPAGKPKGGLVVIQEIFGLNEHIRDVCDRFAAEGYLCVGPAIQDRAQPGFEVGYTPPEIEKGREMRGKVKNEDSIKDIKAAFDYLKKESGGKVGVVGYCWGGSLAWLAATEIDGLAVALSYYGGEVAANADRKSKCPVMFHFGEKDASIPLDKVELVKQKQPDHPIYVYEGAGHGFTCDARGSYHPASSDLALKRSKEYLTKYVG